jgi:uncharacterized membrane protein
MNHNRRIFAFLSLGLLLAAVLLPIIIAAFGPLVLAMIFCIVAAFLAILFGALSWSERIGRTVAMAALAVLVAVGGSYASLSEKRRAESQPATVAPMPPESAEQR